METIIKTLRAAGFRGNADQMLDILIQFDVQMCLDVLHTTSAQLAVDRWTMSHLPAPNGLNKNAAKQLATLLQNKRKYFLIGMRGENISVYPLRLRAAVHGRLLSLVAKDVPEKNWKQEILAFTKDGFSKRHSNTTQEIITEYLDSYSGCSRALTKDTRNLLKKSLREIDLYAEKARKGLLGRQDSDVKTAEAPAAENNSQEAPLRIKPAFLNSKERKIRFQCLLEYALQEQEQNRQKDWFAPIRSKWNSFIPDLVLVDNLAKQVAAAVYRTLPGQIPEGEKRKCETPLDCYYRALGVALEEGGFQKIRNEAVLRSLVMNRAVALYVSYLDPDDLGSDTVEIAKHEILNRLSQVNYVAGSSDPEDLTKILKLYMEDGCFDPELVRLISPHRELYKELFRSTMEFMNSRNQAFKALSSQLEQIDQYRDAVAFDTRKDLIDALDRGSHGYCLGRMYRVALGKETLSQEDAQTLMRSFFYLMENLGIQAVAGNLMDQIITEEDPIHKLCIPFYQDTAHGAHKLIYPGWAINGCQVAPPVYQTEEDSYEN